MQRHAEPARGSFVRRSLPGAIIALGVGLVLAGCSLMGELTPPPGYAPFVLEPDFPPIPASVTRGVEIFFENCTRCHGPEGRGDSQFVPELIGNVPDLTEPTLADSRTLQDYYATITNGRLEALMPPWRDALSIQERWDVAAYILTLSLPDEALETGEALYLAECAACHGDSGRGDGPEAVAPLLDLSTGEYTVTHSNATLLAVLGIAHPPALLAGLTTAEQSLLAAWVRLLAFTDLDVLAVAPTATPAPALAVALAEAGSGVVAGQLVNGTTAGEIPAGVEVVLSVFDNFVEGQPFTTTTDADGNFEFTEVPLLPERVFLIVTDYNGVSFASNPIIVAPEQTLYTLDVRVFDSTGDDSALEIERLVLFFEFVSRSQVQVVSLVTFGNRGDRVVVGAAGVPAVELSLPPGATDVQFEEELGLEYVITAAGLGLLDPIAPGSSARQLLFSYQLPYDRSLDLALPIDYPVAGANILLPEGAAQLSGPGLQAAGVSDVQGVVYQTYFTPPLQPGDTLTLHLSNMGSTGIQLLDDTNPRETLTGLGMLLIAAAIVIYLFTQDRKQQAAAATQNPRQQRDALLQQLADLDIRYDADELSGRQHTRRRNALKQQLIHLLQTHGLGVED